LQYVCVDLKQNIVRIFLFYGESHLHSVVYFSPFQSFKKYHLKLETAKRFDISFSVSYHPIFIRRVGTDQSFHPEEKSSQANNPWL